MGNKTAEGFTHATAEADHSVKGVLDQVIKRDDLESVLVFMFTEDGLQIVNSAGISREAWALASVYAARHATVDFDDWINVERQ